MLPSTVLRARRALAAPLLGTLALMGAADLARATPVPTRPMLASSGGAAEIGAVRPRPPMPPWRMAHRPGASPARTIVGAGLPAATRQPRSWHDLVHAASEPDCPLRVAATASAAPLDTARRANAVSSSLPGPIQFETATWVPGPAYASGIAIADLDGDGHLDVVETGFAAGGISVYPGNGDGKFPTLLNRAIPGTPGGLTLADVDHDGRLDVIVPQFQDPGYLSVARNLGGFAFAPSIDLPVPRYADAVVAADVNHDGALDLIATHYDTAMVSVTLGRPGGGFQPPVLLRSGSYPTGVLTARFGGSSDAIVTADFNCGGMSLSDLRDTTRALATREIPAGTGTYGILAPDLDGDGEPDLMAIDNAEGTLTRFRRREDGMFDALESVVVGLAPDALAAGDLDGDGSLDFVTGSFWDGSVTPVLHTKGGFTRMADVAAGTKPSSIAAGDLDEDGIPDLVVADYSGGFTFLHGLGHGKYRGPTVVEEPGFPRFILLRDLDGDGADEMITASDYPPAVFVHRRGRDGIWRIAQAIPVGDYSVGGYPYAMAAGDLDGDGHPDVVVALGDLACVAVLKSRADGTLGPPARIPVDPGPSVVAVADMNGDGLADIITGGLDDLQLSIRYSHRDGSITERRIPLLSGTRDVAAGDLDHDGLMDLYVVEQSPSTSEVSLQTAAGEFVSHRSPSGFHGYGAEHVTLADMDGDGTLDAVVLGGREKQLAILDNLGNGSFLPHQRFGVPGTALSDLAIADLDGDGSPDALVTDADANTLSVFENTGRGSLNLVGTWATGLAPLQCATDDIDGDGLPEVCVTDFNDHSIMIFHLEKRALARSIATMGGAR